MFEKTQMAPAQRPPSKETILKQADGMRDLARRARRLTETMTDRAPPPPYPLRRRTRRKRVTPGKGGGGGQDGLEAGSTFEVSPRLHGLVGVSVRPPMAVD